LENLSDSAKRAAGRAIRAVGYDVRRYDRLPTRRFWADAMPYAQRHEAQTLATVQELRERYRTPVFGEVTVWSRLGLLAHVIDRFDPILMNASQEVHTLQMVEAMRADGVHDDDLLLAGILHDVGKVLDLVGEDPANVFGRNDPIGEYDPGCGFDQVVFQWNHDEFAYSRFMGRVPDEVAWLLRYHSVVPKTCVHLMDDRDREYYDRYWTDFYRWDLHSKSVHAVPRTRLRDYRSLVEAAFPDPIPF
jgi:inositol oxygenase